MFRALTNLTWLINLMVLILFYRYISVYQFYFLKFQSPFFKTELKLWFVLLWLKFENSVPVIQASIKFTESNFHKKGWCLES